jgi:hypothetical protein
MGDFDAVTDFDAMGRRVGGIMVCDGSGAGCRFVGPRIFALCG